MSGCRVSSFDEQAWAKDLSSLHTQQKILWTWTRRSCLADKCTIPGFQSVVTHGRTQKTMTMGHQLNVMTQAPYSDDKADLPNGLYVMRTYMELKDSSQSVSVVLRNLTAQPIHLARGQVISRVAAANAVPEAQCSSDLLKKLGDEGEDKPEPTKLSMQQRQELLLAALERDSGLDHLKDWPPELARRAKSLVVGVPPCLLLGAE